VPTGLACYDGHTGGLQAENLIVLAGLSGVGKTAWVLNIAAEATLRAHVPTLLFSLELSRAEAIERLLATESGIEADRMRKGLFEYSEWKSHIYPLGERFTGAPLVIDDTSAPTVHDVRSKTRRFLHDATLFPNNIADQRALVIIDSLHMVAPKQRGDTAEREIADVTRGLKNLAKECRVALIAVSGLNRAFEKRENKRPRLTDLRGSGSIEDHADVVLFLHRGGDAHGERGDDCATDLIIAKHRSAPRTCLALAFNLKRLRFEERAQESEE
jgi:replicative DNA helicase